jgi:uncharacterized membrane protein (DUF106 family)
MAYYDFLNIVFAPILGLPILWVVIIVSLLISLIIIFITKYTTDQKLMKGLKEDIKSHQNRIKELKNNPSEAMAVQKKAMELNMKYMMHSLRPTLITFIPIILIFGWMSANFAYDGIAPGEEFAVTAFFNKGAAGEVMLNVVQGVQLLSDPVVQIENNQATWTLAGDTGEYILEIDYQENKNQKIVIISEDDSYISPNEKYKNSPVKEIRVGNSPKKILNLFGWRLGWLGTYIIFSLIFTMSLRKFLKVY